ncbi:MAG: MurR/RpiR family transcriptional regulator [Clostridia bacterium]|nr:MurR/RpiR family transcriptional regulator [Clostridia bacterium]
MATNAEITVGKGNYMNSSYYLLTNLLSDEEQSIITSMIHHIESGERRIGIREIAAENYVSSTFIMKMCKRLGFDGYSELYYHLSQRVSIYSKTPRTAALHELIDNYDDEKGENFCRIMSEVRDRKLFAVGNGFSALVADYLVQRLSVCGFMVFNSVHFYDFMIFHEGGKGVETNIAPSVIIAISQSGECESVISDVKSALQHGFRVISFTKREDSTLAQLSDLTFLVDAAKQTLIGGIPNPFFGRVILAFEELVGAYLRYQGEHAAQ